MSLTVKEYSKDDTRGVAIQSKFFKIIMIIQVLFALGIIGFVAASFREVGEDIAGVYIVAAIIIFNFIFVFYGQKITLTRSLANGNIVLTEKIFFKSKKVEFTPNERPFLMLYNPVFQSKFTKDFYILSIVDEHRKKVVLIKSLNKKTPALWNFTRDQATFISGILGLKLVDEIGTLSGDILNYKKSIFNM